ncbi:MAG: HAD-IC family P-type ATPase, partial [Devosia sp.]|nr:HAD-IC family P-type ATPase [Devosia sp.]
AGTVTRLSADGSRVLAIASGTDAHLSLEGFITLSDPPRPDSAALIADLRRRGVRVLLATGDGEATARAIAARVGITGEVAPAGALRGSLDAGTVSGFTIFPGVYPEEKFRLVEGLQRAGHIVGMTGDGVNDAPALRQADVGIAVAQATDVAKAAASLVLTKPGLGEIVRAIDESRRIFRRMKNFVLTMTSRKLSMPTFLALGVILAGSFVLQPVQIVLLLLVGDFASMAVSTDRVTPSAAPDRWSIPPLIATGLSIAAILLALNGAVFWSAASIFRLDAAATQTLVFVWLVFGASQAVLYLTRGQGFFWSRPYPGRLLILATVAAVALVTLLASQGWLMAPIPLPLIGAMLLQAMVFLVAGDLLQVGIARLVSARSRP